MHIAKSQLTSSELRLPLITIRQQLLLVVQKLLPGLRSVFRIRRLNNSIDWTALLAETAVDALGHINIVSSRPPASISSLLGFDCDSLSWADL